VDPLIDVLAGQITALGLHATGDDSREMEHYRELMENAGDIVFTHDLQGNFTSVNRVVQSVTGYSREEVLKLNLADLLTPESLEHARRTIQERLGGGSQAAYDMTVRRRDGRIVTLEVSAHLLFRAGQPVGVLGIARDISGRKRSDGHLHLLRSVVVNANDAVLIAEAKAGDHLGGKII
jgi:PAS domain S-box-containing protein